jgi:death-on-curing protein
LPAAGFGGKEAYPHLSSKVAALAYSVVKGHACADGNKRLAVILSSAFLELNDHQINAGDDEVEHIFRVVGGSDAAEHDAMLDDLRHWFTQCIGPYEEE